VATPGVVKTLGALNIVFGVGLMLCGTAFDAYFVALPSLMSTLERQQESVQDQFQQRRDAEIQALRVQEEKAETAEEKARARADRIAAESQPLPNPPMPMADLSMYGLDDPRVRTHYAVEGATCLLVNLLMLISGIGLLRLKNWGRRMAIQVAVLKVVRLVLLTGSLMFIVQPILDAKQAQAQARQPDAGQLEAMKTVRSFTSIFLILFLGVGSVYPALVILLLTRPGARSATLRNSTGE